MLQMERYIGVLQTLAGLRSRKEKILLLKHELQDEDFRKFVKYVVDPFLTYGVTTYDIQPHSAYGTDAPFFELLDRIITRKLTGGNAREALGAYAIVADGMEEGIRRLLKKDLECNVGTKTLNKAYPGLIREFLIALAEPYEPGSMKLPLYGSPKYDGFRCLAICTSRKHVTMLSSNGKELPGAEHVKPYVAHYYRKIRQPFVFDSELIADNLYNTGRYARRKKAEAGALVIKVFDYIPYELFLQQAPTRPLHERLDLLGDLLPPDGQGDPVALTEHVLLHSEDELQSLYRHYLSLKYEGLMAKDPNALYQYKRSKAWCKVKPTDTLDLPVLRVLEGQGQFKGTTGSLVVDYNGKEVHVYGFTRKDRDRFWKCMPEIVEVEFQDETPDGSLRHARFISERLDKT